MQLLFETVNKMIYLFYLPKGLMEKIIGITDFGQMEPIFKALFSEAKEMDSFVKFLLKKEKRL